MSSKDNRFVGVMLFSKPTPRPGQKKRSSKNYDLRKMKRSDQIEWENNVGAVFDVMEDRTLGKDPVTFKNVEDGTVTSFPSDSACNGLYIANPSNAKRDFYIWAKCRDKKAPAHSWMSRINGDLPISDLCIPGTHDSGATRFNRFLGRCQTLSIFDQLYKKGVRFLDIRCKIDSDGKRMQIYHGFISESKSLEEVLYQCRLFLALSPGECIVMSIKNEDGSEPEKFEKILRDNYLKSEKYGSLFVTEETIPKLETVRGKIVLFRRFECSSALGINAFDDWKNNTEFTIKKGNKDFLSVQDRYHVSDGKEKAGYVKEFMKKSLSSAAWSINFASGYSSYMFIPSTAAISNEVNPMLDEYLASNDFKGVILMDFIDQDSGGDRLSVSEKIIAKNFK